MNQFILLDAAIWRGHSKFDELISAVGAVPLYADLPSHDARLFGPWLLDAEAFDASIADEAPPALPWRYGVSRLFCTATVADLGVHFETQRSIAMEAGDRYYLRYADTRALAALARVLTPVQVQQLKGPVLNWGYVDRFGEVQEFGAGAPSSGQRQTMIMLSEEQGTQLLEHQLAGALADEIDTASGGRLQPLRVAAQYRHVEDAAAFVLEYGIGPFEVQRHIAAVTVETDGTLLTHDRFLEQVQGLQGSTRWHELMVWRAVSKT